MADVQEGAPTPDQLGNIIDYLGESKIGSVVSGATSSSDALRKLKADENAFQRPVVVDWHNGRAGMSPLIHSVSGIVAYMYIRSRRRQRERDPQARTGATEGGDQGMRAALDGPM